MSSGTMGRGGMRRRLASDAAAGTRCRASYDPAMPSTPSLDRTIRGRLVIARNVANALRAGRPVVALESTLISHGLPHPENVEVARASEAAVRDADAVPATIAIRDGKFLVGLDDASLEALATARPGSVEKAARPS